MILTYTNYPTTQSFTLCLRRAFFKIGRLDAYYYHRTVCPGPLKGVCCWEAFRSYWRSLRLGRRSELYRSAAEGLLSVSGRLLFIESGAGDLSPVYIKPEGQDDSPIPMDRLFSRG